jgi:hypothetical protein
MATAGTDFFGLCIFPPQTFDLTGTECPDMWENCPIWNNPDTADFTAIFTSGRQYGRTRLDGRISEEFWCKKSAEWQAEEQGILALIESHQVARPERLLDAAKILEFANKAYFLYLKPERAKLLKMVLSNCAIACRKSVGQI